MSYKDTINRRIAEKTGFGSFHVDINDGYIHIWDVTKARGYLEEGNEFFAFDYFLEWLDAE